MTQADSPHRAGNDNSDDTLGAEIIRILALSDAASLSAPEIAHAVQPDGDWHGLLLPIRRAAIALATQGRLVIYRKGKPVDPQKFSGVYRIGLPRQD